jgi:hypothetical protein
LKNSKGELAVSGKEDLKDMSFMSHSGILPDNTRFAYEKKMLNEWFRRQQKQMKFPANEQKAKKSS